MQRWALVMAIACYPGALVAQGGGADSVTPAARAQQDLWISAGIGEGGAARTGDGLGAMASGWYAYGPYVAGVRASAAGPFFGPGTRDKAALVGLRARSTHAFVLFGVGAGTLSGARSNGEQSGSETVFPDLVSIAYGAEASVNYKVIGIGLDLFGAVAGRTSYTGLAMSIQLGYLK